MTTIEIKGRSYRLGFNMKAAISFQQLTGIDILREPTKIADSPDQMSLTISMIMAMLIGSNPVEADDTDFPTIETVMEEIDDIQKWNAINTIIVDEFNRFLNPGQKPDKPETPEVPEKKKGQKKKH